MTWRQSKQCEQPTPPDSAVWVRILRTPQEIEEARQRAAAYQVRAQAALGGKQLRIHEVLQALQAQDRSTDHQAPGATEGDSTGPTHTA